MHFFHPTSASRGLVLLAPGGGQDHTSPGVVARGTRLTDRGYDVAVIRSVDEVPAVLAQHTGPVGFWGVSQGARVGLPLLAAESRIAAAVLGLADGPMSSAPLVTAPVLFYLQADDELLRPDACRALFDALGSSDKTLVENPGGHLDLPRTTVEESAAWLDRKLAETRENLLHMGRHVYECHVRFSDVDVYGHVNNVKYFEYYQEARIAFLQSWVDVETDNALRQVVARIDVDYKRPILFRPEPYLVQSWVTRIGTSSYDLDSRIVDPEETGELVYSTSQVRLVAFDLDSQRSRPLTEGERSRLEQART
jgi:YbgC/YbaW family acyl-CoA thioester hydrolase